VEVLREAVDLLASTNAAVDLARARCALGSQRQVTDAEAVPLLKDACRVAEQRGAGGVASRARSELERRGHALEACAELPPPLSSTERQILALTAAGTDVREVAQRLFVTPGTVRAVLDAAQVSLKEVEPR
jgi:DNA-binding NarL/FixJ family response regulator